MIDAFTGLQNTAVLLATSTTSARTSQLAPGKWLLQVDADTFVVQGGSAVVALADGTHWLVRAADQPYEVTIREGDDYIAAILSASTSNLRLINTNRG